MGRISTNDEQKQKEIRAGTIKISTSDIMKRRKVIVVGDSCVGKTALLKRLENPQSLPQRHMDYEATIGVELHFQTLGDTKLKMKFDADRRFIIHVSLR